MLATRELLSFLAATEGWSRWRMANVLIALPRLRLDIDGLQFFVDTSIGMYFTSPRSPGLVRMLTVRTKTDSAWRTLRSSSWFRNVQERLGKPAFRDIRGRREADFAQRVPAAGAGELSQAIALVSAAISPPDPRFDFLSVLPLPWRLETISFERRERIRCEGGNAWVVGSVTPRAATLCAWLIRKTTPFSVLTESEWGRRSTKVLRRAGYRTPRDPSMMVFSKPAGGIRELARFDSLIERAPRR